ncbi:hypothetical protein [Nocardia pneumoniae]|uniref:hypothetical protein n=1 Tax=Nocardia pneumoniae TaxID=228601 RepID=UPI0002DB535D|nr:hypothetical protein [Nocardia pneumoniae]
MRVDWQAYYDAADKCHKLANDIALALGPLHRTLVHDCAKMAGDSPGCKDWGESYDKRARDLVRSTATLANALTRYGDVLAANGYNYGISNKSNPPPPRPTPSEPLYDSGMAMPVSSIGDNGAGIESTLAELLNEVIKEFGKLPNGHTENLGKAHDAWKAFSSHTALTEASSRVGSIIALFEAVDDDNAQDILGHLNVLKRGTDGIAQASLAITAPVGEYQSSLHSMRTELQSAVHAAEATIAATVVAGVVLAAFSFGASAVAAAGGVTAVVGNAINVIRTVYTGSRLIRVIGLATAAAGAAVAVKAFDAVPDFSFESALVTIASLPFKLFEDEYADNINGGAADGPFATATLTTDPKKIAKQFGVPRGDVNDAIHELKKDAKEIRANGRNNNPDVVVDLESGDVYVKLPGGQASEESIGNIRDYLPRQYDDEGGDEDGE